MAIEDAVSTILQEDVGVSALVVKRITPMVAPESPVYPCIVYLFVSETVPNAMGKTTDLVRRRLQVDCWGDTPTDAQTLADAVITALDRYSGTAASIVIQDIYRLGVNDIFDFEARKFKRAVDFDVVFEE